MDTQDDTIDMDVLAGDGKKEFAYFGMDCNAFKLGDKVYEALENPDDGYRSSLDHVRIITNPAELAKLVFPRRRLATVTIRTHEVNTFEGWQLVDVDDGHVWAEVGTCNSDDYYPSFICNHFPQEPRS